MSSCSIVAYTVLDRIVVFAVSTLIAFICTVCLHVNENSPPLFRTPFALLGVSSLMAPIAIQFDPALGITLLNIATYVTIWIVITLALDDMLDRCSHLKKWPSFRDMLQTGIAGLMLAVLSLQHDQPGLSIGLATFLAACQLVVSFVVKIWTDKQLENVIESTCVVKQCMQMIVMCNTVLFASHVMIIVVNISEGCDGYISLLSVVWLMTSLSAMYTVVAVQGLRGGHFKMIFCVCVRKDSDDQDVHDSTKP
jgi:hypothetical protein